MVVANGDPDARRRREHLAGHLHRLAEFFEHALGDLSGGAGPVDILEQDRELVARQARDQVGIAHARLQAGGDLLEHLVAGEVAEAVVDDLEAVDVEVQQRAAAVWLVLEPRQRAVEPGAQVVSVGQPGQGVVQDLVLELVLDALALADLLTQLVGAHQHALLQQHQRFLLDPGGSTAGQAVGDLRGDEAEQLLVGRPVPLRRVVTLHRDQPDRLLADHQRRAQPARRQRAYGVELDLALFGQCQGARLADDQLAVLHHVLAEPSRHRARFVGLAGFVDRVRVLHRGAIDGQQRDEEIACGDQAADDLMYFAVEILLVDVDRGQFRDLEQRRLQPLGALAFGDLQLQATVGCGQFQGALADTAFEVVLAALALQRGEDVATDELQQRLVIGRVDDAGPVALHHDRAGDHAVAQHRHAHPVEAVGADVTQRPGDLRLQLLAVAAQRLAVAQHVPGQCALALAEADVAFRRQVLGVDEIQEVHQVARRV